MKTRLYLILLLIILLSYITISGCGSGSGITQVNSLTTPSSYTSDNMSYLTFRVKWPKQSLPGTLLISPLSDKKEITGSIAAGSHKVVIKIFSFIDKDPNISVNLNDQISFLGGGNIIYPDTETTVAVAVSNTFTAADSTIFDAQPIKIWAGCFSDPNATDLNSALLSTEHYMILRVGNQTANLQLGDYNLTVEPYESLITLPPQSRIGANETSDPYASPSPGITPDISPTPQDTPTPFITPPSGGIVSTTITARLMIIYPSPAPNPSPEPGTTAIPASTPKPAEHRLVKFKLLSGNAYLSPVSGYTNSEGYCTTTLTADTAGTNIIEASFEPDANAPDNAYKQTCQVEVEGGEADETYYEIDMGTLDPEIVVNGRTTIHAILRKNKYPDWEVAPGKTINFKVIPPYGATVTSSATTDNEGACDITFTGNAAGSYSVEAEFKDPASDPEAPPFTASCPINVIKDLIWEDDFEAYTPGIWPESNWIAWGDATWDTANHVISSGGNQSLQLHSANTAMALRPMIGTPCEVKFDIRIGSGDVNDLNHYQYTGFGSFDYLGRYYGHNFLWFDLVRNSQDVDIYKIYGLNSDFGSYNPGTWYTVHVRFGKEPKITYWVNGYNTIFTDISPVNYQNYTSGYLHFGLDSGSTIWIDNIKVYSRHGLDD